MAETSESQFDWNRFFLIFFFICFVFIMTIGTYAIFFYNVNAPESAPKGGTHGGMILPGDGKYAPHIEVHRLA